MMLEMGRHVPLMVGAKNNTESFLAFGTPLPDLVRPLPETARPSLARAWGLGGWSVGFMVECLGVH